MDPVDKEFGSAMGALFHQVITDMKVGAPLWEDFLSKASKLHTALKSTLSVIAAYLDAFQKIADSATNAKGATKDIGTVLTRICLRHKAVEARLKTFTSALMECLVLPLHDKLEEWKRVAIHLDKEHTKEYKKVKTDIKKRTTEAQRWQKKAKKIRSGMGASVASGVGGGQASLLSSSVTAPPGGGGSNQHLNAANQELLRAADAAQNDLNSRLALLQETEKQALRSALVEERSRYCLFVACLKPVMSEEMAMMAELSHLEEIINQLDKHTADPFSLPSSTEQMIAELKGSNDQTHQWALQTPPSSPSSLGSRKSSMCSLGSIHSSSSGSVASALPPGQQQLSSSSLGGPNSHLVQQLQLQQQQHMRHRSLSQVAGVNVVRLSSVSSQDSGFTSQDTLVLRPTSSPPSNQLAQEATASSDSSSSCNSNSSTPCTPYPPGMGSTWPNLQETIQFDRTANNSLVVNERPHTISTAYEKGGHHQRPALSVYTFQPLDQQHDSADSSSSSSHPVEYETLKRCKDLKAGAAGSAASSQESLSQSVGRPPLPQRCSSLERPVTTKTKDKVNKKNALVLPPGGNDSVLPDFHQAAPDMIVPQPVYMNASELQQLSLGCNGDDPASHAIYSSLASCTVYDDGQACSCHGPSTSDLWRPVQSRPVLRRPASFSGYADPNSIAAQQMDWALRSGGGNGSVRMSTIKRTSIPSFATLHEVSNVDETHVPYVEDLAPPPPAPSDPPFHLGVTPVTNASSVEDIDLTSLPPPPDFLLAEESGSVGQQQSAETIRIITERSLSVADAVKTLNEIRHQPASPGVVRRAQSMRTTSDSPIQLPVGRQKTGPATAPKSKHQNHHHHHSSTLQHSVSMKSAIKSPLNHKTLPRHLPSQPVDYDQMDSSGQSKVVSDLLSKSSFVHQLNAKLAQQQHGQDSGNGTPTGKNHHQQHQQQRPQLGQPEVLTSSRESLMDQIRRGTALRRARSTSDRSSPHFNQKHHH